MTLTISSTVTLSSGHELPRLGLGVFRNEACVPACQAALNAGCRHIDTAQMYDNEEAVGAAVKASGVPRESVFITTKVVHGGDETAHSIQESLTKLDLGYIDLYLIHSAHGGRDVRLQTWKTLLDHAGPKDKPLRSVGVSNYAVKHLEEIREAGMPAPAVNQIELHPFCQQAPIVEYCQRHGIVVEAYCPLVRGEFSNPVLQDIAKEYKKDVAQILIRWSLQRGFVPLPKSSNPARVISNADVYDFELSHAAMAKINALDRGSGGAISWNPVNVD